MVTTSLTCFITWPRPAEGEELTDLMRDLHWLESKAEAGYVFDIAMDFTRTLEAIPADHPARTNLRLLEQALRTDLHFLSQHPTTLFQCLWNLAWWYDAPESAVHCPPPVGCWPHGSMPWDRPASERLSTLLSSWRAAKESRSPGFIWLRALPAPIRPGWRTTSLPRRAQWYRPHRIVVARRRPARQRIGRWDGAGVGNGERT